MTAESDRIAQYLGREHLAEAILAALTARGVSLDALTVEVLAPVDQFHGGGKPVTGRLARLAAIRPGPVSSTWAAASAAPPAHSRSSSAATSPRST